MSITFHAVFDPKGTMWGNYKVALKVYKNHSHPQQGNAIRKKKKKYYSIQAFVDFIIGPKFPCRNCSESCLWK